MMLIHADAALIAKYNAQHEGEPGKARKLIEDAQYENCCQSISDTKMRIVIENYFKKECDVNTSIREAFEKGFRIGVMKGMQVKPEPSEEEK